jgi:hypothetical protein
MPLQGVTTELLVRYLDTWVPTALHAGRRATFVQAWSDTAEAETAEADTAALDAAESVLRVFAEFADRLGGRRVTLVFLAPDSGPIAARLAAAQAELRTPPALAVHPVAGAIDTHLSAVLTAAQAAGAPILAHVHTDHDLPVRAIAAGRPAEMLALTPTGRHAEHAAALREAGCTLVSVVELVADDAARLLVFGTTSMRSLEAFKNALWQLDEWAGVRIRDPHDADGHLLDISLHPHPGPLRREILAHLAAYGERSVTDLRRFALTDTVYRVADVTEALGALIAAGSVTRDPPHGRLAGDTVVALAR